MAAPLEQFAATSHPQQGSERSACFRAKSSLECVVVGTKTLRLNRGQSDADRARARITSALAAAHPRLAQAAHAIAAARPRITVARSTIVAPGLPVGRP